ncbi:MAG TPA: tyrosine--tRNA ligase [Dehalococcoidia bacterium]|nr:tyrosine--tRNA ligase [Dehalococcoidia bacterium]
MPEKTASIDEQMRVFMRGVEFGDANIEKTMRDELRARLAEGRPLRVYCGFDPTFTDLTLGNLIPMLKLRQFQRFGHEVTFLFGTMTGIVGDPSDKTAARQMLTVAEVEANAQSWLRQVYRVLDKDKTLIKANADWLAKLTLVDVINVASNFTVSQFLDHDTYRRRLAEQKPLYLHEFMYALMQAYDAYEMKTDVQVGGIDQLFNIMAGRQLQRARGEKPLVALCVPLLLGTDGHTKMSKSAGNHIGLDDAPADMYGKLMSIPDTLMFNYYELLTDVPMSESSALVEKNPMDAKKRLARAVVALLYDEAAAADAEAEFERVIQKSERPSVPADRSSFPAKQVGDIKVTTLSSSLVYLDVPFEKEDIRISPFWLRPGHAGYFLPQILVDSGLVNSLSEARRLLRQGAIEIDGNEQLDDFMHSESFKDGTLIKVGKHRFLVIADASSG